MKRLLWLSLAIPIVLCLGSVQAQAQTILRVNVPFAFSAGGQSLPAGAYEVVQGPAPALTLRSADGQARAVLMPVTRLAQREAQDGQDELVFDKVANKDFLSEVWYAGEDGFLVLSTPGPHTHTRVKGAPRK
jgi:hypothetical protein